MEVQKKLVRYMIRPRKTAEKKGLVSGLLLGWGGKEDKLLAYNPTLQEIDGK